MFDPYPVLAMIALGWALPDSRPRGSSAQLKPGAEKDLFDFGLAVRLRAGVRRVQ